VPFQEVNRVDPTHAATPIEGKATAAEDRGDSVSTLVSRGRGAAGG
jgi:hypothetical protein